MNIAMASLSVQLVLYAVAWLLLGHTFRLRRSVAILWSSAWFAGACCTLLVFVSATYTTVNLDLVVNTLVLCCFLLIQQGLDHCRARDPHVQQPERRLIHALQMLRF